MKKTEHMNEPKFEPMLLNMSQAAALLNVSRPILTSFINREKHPLPVIRTTRLIMIPRAAIERWIEEEVGMQMESR